nr:protein SIEVE ELEMENT OCCLUSION B-like [Ipomoea batatas]
MDLDDVVIAEQVMATHHDVNGSIELDANFVINLAENIFNPNTVCGEVEQDMQITEKSIQEFREVDKDMPMPQAPIQKELSYQIKQLSFESLRHGMRPFPFIGLKDQKVLLIIVSDTNLSEVAFLYHHLFKFDISPWIILIPIIDYPQVWTDARLPLVSKRSRTLELFDPCKRVTPQFIRFVKERCLPSFQSGGEPIVISLDSRGRLVHTNALHMILTWRDALAHDTLTIGVSSVIDDIEERKHDLVNRIRETIDDWRDGIKMRIKDLTARKYDIFFCGGNDAKYIQEFATKVKEINSEIQLDIKFAYIGNNKKAKSLMKNISGYALSSNNAEYLWFWTRVRSAFLSRINYLNKIGRIEDEDKIFLGLQKLLAYEAKSTTFEAWVLLSKGEEVVACDLGDKMMRVMNAYQKWKNNIGTKGFSQAFKDCYEELAFSQDQHSCCTLEYPLTLDKIPEDVKCPQCSHNMHKFSHEVMAWRTPMNTVRPQMAGIHPTAAQGENAGPIPVPMFAAYDPKDRTDPLHLHPNESPSLQINNPTEHTAEFNLETDPVLPSGEVHYLDTDGQMQEATISSRSHDQTQEDTYEQTHPVPAVQTRENITEPDPQPRRQCVNRHPGVALVRQGISGRENKKD